MRWIVLLHVASAFALVAGMVGRNVCLARARDKNDISAVNGLLDAAGVLEHRLVRPGSFAVLIAGLWAMFAGEFSLTTSGNRWLLVSLVLFACLALLVPAVFLPRGRVFEAALIEANTLGTVTPALSKAFRDPAVIAARRIEEVIVAAILVLMVAKPF